MSVDEYYNDAFYEDQAKFSYQSAQIVLKYVFEHLVSATSLLDIGCGTGSWLSAATKLGVKNILGLDSSSSAANKLMIDKKNWKQTDISQPISLHRKFDLAMSMEVAEHINVDLHECFINNLTRHADTIIFSAALPYQGGTGHQSENWPQYWAALFSEKGYDCYDIIRHNIWNNPKIQFWYKQNIFIFAKQSLRSSFNKRNLFHTNNIMSLIHPEMYLWSMARNNTEQEKQHNRDLTYYLALTEGQEQSIKEPILYGKEFENKF